MSTARGGGAGRVAAGLVLVAIGLVWLVVSTGAIVVDWAVVVPAALVVVGLAVLATARSGSAGPLIGIGVILTVLAVLSALVAPAFSPSVFGGGIGDREVGPDTVDDPGVYRLAIGNLTVDLRDADDLPDEIEASVGMGELTVLVPDDVDVVLDASVGAGEIHAFGEERNGTGVTLEQTFRADDDGGTLELDASVMLGQLEVRR